MVNNIIICQNTVMSLIIIYLNLRELLNHKLNTITVQIKLKLYKDSREMNKVNNAITVHIENCTNIIK